jgi:hypothetical protein
VTINGVSRKVTQIGFPESVNNTVHTSGVYASRGTNSMSNSSDGIFADSLSSELVTPAGSAGAGYTATFQIALAVSFAGRYALLRKNQPTRPSAVNPTTPCLSRRRPLVDGGAGAFAIRPRYSSASGEVTGRGTRRRSGAGIHRLM